MAAGAFGAHALRDTLSPERLATFETATRYLFLHALALVVVGTAGETIGRGAVWAARAFLAGCVLFSGSLLALVLLDLPWLGVVTPFGGLTWIAGWVVLAAAFWRR